ncbi:hypothetical protein [Sphingosinicella humi]|uniref:Uncharacterized protein n=1 Tax=Allosphingosinicella humi TaxID=2068657 RepID=A0A2U2J587_9SPHN|nr:hypothetical protein [Sphingosinicella humi]PWG03503.1 hypothetical protein DF286_11945 [Sphingosinicella humi]
MKYKDAERLARMERSRRAAFALADLAGWDIDLASDIFFAGLGELIYAPQPDTVIVLGPADGRRDKCASYIQQTRSSVLFIEPGKSQLGNSTIYMSLARSAKGQVHWHDELRLWSLGKDDELWLLPDPEGSCADGATFLLGQGPLRQTSDRPWKDQQEHGFGFGCADTLLFNSGGF